MRLAGSSLCVRTDRKEFAADPDNNGQETIRKNRYYRVWVREWSRCKEDRKDSEK